MHEGLHSQIVAAPINRVWSFVSNIGLWAPLVPGYISHEILTDRELIWEFKGDLGMIKKKIKLHVDILEWKEPTKVSFKLRGLNEKFDGHGYFTAEQRGVNTKMTGCLAIMPKGAKAALMNPLLKSYIPQLTREFAEAVAKEIEREC